MKKTIAFVTAISFAIGPTLPILGTNVAYAADDTPTAVSILNTVNTGLQGAQSAVYQFGATQAQLGQMVQSAQGLNRNNALIGQNMGLLQQIQGQLGMAFAEADKCGKDALASGNKKFTKLLEKKVDLDKAIGISPTQLETVEASCENYPAVTKSAEFAIDQLQRTNLRMACMRNLQNKIGTIVESAKQPFSQLTIAANEAVGIRDQIIKQYENTRDKITGDLDGENGYRAKLQGLKELSTKLMSALNAGGGTDKDGNSSAGGLARRADQLKQKRKSVASLWLNQISSQSMKCFNT